MDIIAFLKKRLTPKSTHPVDRSKISQTELRLHPRYSVAQFGLFFVLDPNKIAIPVQDISYGGIAIEATDRPNDWLQTSAVEVELVCLTSRCQATLIPIHKSSQQIGYAFVHNSISTLTFLRPILEDMRLGYSLQAIAEQWRKEEYRSNGWHVMRGDGPVDLVFQVNDGKSKIIDLMMTFRQDQQYHEIRLKNNRWRTLHSIQEPGVAVRMFETPEIDVTAVVRSLYILTGAYSRFCNPAIANLIERLISDLKMKYAPQNPT